MIAQTRYSEHGRNAADGRPLGVIIDPVGGALAIELANLLGNGGTLLFDGGLAHEPLWIPSILLSARQITLRGVAIKGWLDSGRLASY